MPTTRSMKALSAAVKTVLPTSKSANSSKLVKSKRKKTSEEEVQSEIISPVKKPRIAIPDLSESASITQSATETQVLPAVLSFSFAAAKQHLIDIDARFQDIFNKLPCRPFEHLERVDPFRTLTTSILGQQISWLAARSITHRFIRLYYPHLPEKLPPADSSEAKTPQDVFPTAQQVAGTEIDVLRTAGLSGRKAEYVKDLASRFADGRLTTQKLIEADDEELARLLIEVRGIGRWTSIDMFAIFSLRRPDILPVGDLGVQRGILRWFLALHSQDDPVSISPKKLPKNPGNSNDDDSPIHHGTADSKAVTSVDSTKLPGPPPPATLASQEDDISSLPPVPATPVKKRGGIPSTEILGTATMDQKPIETGNMTVFPEPFTPSINKILKREHEQRTTVPSLPEGLNVTTLKSRLSGKKVKGAFLTPKEMEELTEPWRPYRSLGVYYMWALAEEPTPKK